MKSTVHVVDSLLKKNVLKRKNYVAHRGSSFMDSIYNKFKKLKGGATKIVGRIDNDKWNPGDIWLSTLTEIPSFDNLAEYNEWLTRKFDNGELISISLKKAEKSNPPLKIYNKYDEEVPNNVNYKKVRRPKSPFSSTGMTIDTSLDPIVFRTFTINQKGNIRGEISGVEAAGGKVSYGIINYYLDNNIGEKMISKNAIIKMDQDERLDKLEELYKEIDINYDGNMYEEGLQDFLTSIESKKENYYDGW